MMNVCVYIWTFYSSLFHFIQPDGLNMYTSAWAVLQPHIIIGFHPRGKYRILMEDATTLPLKAACQPFCLWKLFYYDMILLPNDSTVLHVVVRLSSRGGLERNVCSCHLPAAVSTLRLSIWWMWWNNNSIHQNLLAPANHKENHIYPRLPFWESKKKKEKKLRHIFKVSVGKDEHCVK